jgi:hypothetical protein
VPLTDRNAPEALYARARLQSSGLTAAFFFMGK